MPLTMAILKDNPVYQSLVNSGSAVTHHSSKSHISIQPARGIGTESLNKTTEWLKSKLVQYEFVSDGAPVMGSYAAMFNIFCYNGLI